jgi:hypothetical protein
VQLVPRSSFYRVQTWSWADQALGLLPIHMAMPLPPLPPSKPFLSWLTRFLCMSYLSRPLLEKDTSSEPPQFFYLRVFLVEGETFAVRCSLISVPQFDPSHWPAPLALPQCPGSNSWFLESGLLALQASP